jgi:hypothetical protein
MSCKTNQYTYEPVVYSKPAYLAADLLVQTCHQAFSSRQYVSTHVNDLAHSEDEGPVAKLL